MKNIKQRFLLKILTLKFYYFKILCFFGIHKRMQFNCTKKLPIHNKSILKRDFKIVDFYSCKICGRAKAYERN